MSDLERILKLASHGTADARSQAPAERELKDVPVVEEPTTTREAVGEFAEPIYDLIDMHFEGDCQPVFDDLVRFLSGDQIKEFVDDFRRHHELPMGDDMDEAKQLNASEYTCEDCGDTMHKPTTDCSHDSHDETGSWWKDENGNGVPDSLEEAKAKPDFLDVDKDGDKDEPMKKAIKDKKVDEAEEADTDTEELEEAQSQAQKDAFAKMLASKKGSKDDDKADEVEETNKEELEESPTMDTTQLITLLKNSGLSEEAINKKINEWANTPAGAAEEEATSHGEPYENFAQSVNLSLKRYLDAEDMKVGLKEHKVEDIKEAYKRSKGEK